MYKKLNFLIFAAILLGLATLGLYKRSGDSERLNKIGTNDQYKAIDINQIYMWVSNNGDGSHSPITDGSGFFWPGGVNATITAIFEDGLMYGGKIGREIRVNGSAYRHGLQAGKILDNGLPDDPSLSKYKIYKIRKDWQSFPNGPAKTELENDFNNWPVEDGAPWVDVDGDGVYTKGVDQPHFIGDEVLWFVNNDMDPARSTFTYGTLPMGVEFQTTVFGFNRTGDLGDMVFKLYKMINKGNNTVRDMVVAYWSDTDMGNAADDFSGCDTVLSLGYTYNGDADDENYYGDPAPAVGYDFFQGPKVPYDATDPLVQRFNLPDSAKFDGKWIKGYTNLPMTAFTLYINSDPNFPQFTDPDQGTPAGSIQFYSYMTGKNYFDEAFIDPNTGQVANFVVPGDPVAGIGWYEGSGWPGGPTPGDRRHVMASGTFTFAPGDTQEVAVGLLIGKGSSTIKSVTELKRKDFAAQTAYDLNFNLTPAPPVPVLHASALDKSITLWWENNAESYNEIDPLITGQGLPDTTYNFEGYQLWQYSDQAGSDAQLISTWDVIDSITSVYGNEVINGENVRVPKIVGPNLGARRFVVITKDVINSTSLRNGSPYYFAVTAYGVSLASVPTYLESTPSIIEVRPGKSKIDVTTQYTSGQNIAADETVGVGDAKVLFNVVDPMALTGHKYQVKFYGEGDSDTLSYSLFNTNSNDTLIWKSKEFVNWSKDLLGNKVIAENDTVGQQVFDGFQLLVSNIYADSLFFGGDKYYTKSVTEVKGAGGSDLTPSVNVWGSANSTGKWSVSAAGPRDKFVWQGNSAKQGLLFHDYEIRFGDSSQYFATGFANSLVFFPWGADPLGKGTVPFSIWDIGNTPNDPSDDVRLVVKTRDLYKDGGGVDSTRTIVDTTWSQLPNGSWEEIYAYEDTTLVEGSFPTKSKSSVTKRHPFGAFVITGDLPAAGTVIRLSSVKAIGDGDTFEATPMRADSNNVVVAKSKIGEISVFPNPYYGANKLERSKYTRFMRFTGLPTKATIRIFSLSGLFITKIEKDGTSQYVDWNLLNKDNLPVGSGIFIAYIDMPGIGTKIMKLALIQEQQFIDRL